MLFCQRTHASELWLKVGDVRTLSASAGGVVRVGKRGVVKVIDSGESVRVVGLNPGATTLVVDNQTYSIRVSLSQQKQFLLALRSELKQMMGLKLSQDTQRIEVSGTLLRFSDWLRIAELAQEHSGEYVFRARPLPEVAQQALSHLRDIIKNEGLPMASFSASPELVARVPSTLNLRKRFARTLAPFGIQVESAGSEVDLQPLIRTRVILAEVSKTSSRTFGIEWPSEYKAQLMPSPELKEDILITLKALESQGRAQILASPNLLCRSGGQAHFHAGGEFPIRIVGRHSKDVLWKSHGVILKVKPKADHQGHISVELESEVSMLDMANAVEGVPAIKKSSVKSHFDLPGRRTVALSGLLRQELGESGSGLPWLSEIPVLGRLFSSKSYLKHQSELVVFVTPEIFNASSDEPVTMPEGWVKDEF